MTVVDARCVLTLVVTLVLTPGLFATTSGQSGDPAARSQAAERAMSEGRYGEAAAIYRELVTARPADVRSWWMLAKAFAESGRRIEAVAALRKVTALEPKLPSAWYALGQGYNDIKQDALASFNQPQEAAWRQLLAADALLEKGPLPDAFALYRATLEQLPSMVSIHDSVARIYERTGHAAWAARERAAVTLSAAQCARRKPLCEFRAGRYGAALTAALSQPDSESRYWRARAANELALAAFAHLEPLPDSVERRAVRATVARAEERYTDAVLELKAALTLSPGTTALVYELGSAYYSARDFDQALATLSPLLQAHPDEIRLLSLVGNSLLQLQRPDDALPVLQRLVQRDSTDAAARLALGRAHQQTGNFTAAVPLIEPSLGDDQDGSLHVQLARAYAGLGQKEKAAALLARSQDLQRAAEARGSAAAQRTITPPK